MAGEGSTVLGKSIQVRGEVSGSEDVIVHGESGFIVPVKDTVLLTQYLHELIKSSEQRELMGRAARQRVEALFSTKIIVAEHLSVYQNLLEVMGISPAIEQ